MKTFFTVGLTGMLAFGITSIAMAQQQVSQQERPNQACPAIHGPRSIDQELDHLTKDLELTPSQRKQVKPLLKEHHDRIQALFDKNPKLSRADLGPQIHAISDLNAPRNRSPVERSSEAAGKGLRARGRR